MLFCWQSFGWEILLLASYRFVTDTTSVLSPLIILALVRFLADTGVAVAQGTTPPEAWRGYLLATALFLAQVISGWTNHKYFEKGFRTGFRIRSALTTVLYKKCLRLSPRGRQNFNSGTMVNTMSTDTARMDRAVPFLHLVWSVPFLILLAMVLLLYTLGTPALAGLFLMVLFGPIQVVIMRSEYHKKRLLRTCIDRWTVVFILNILFFQSSPSSAKKHPKSPTKE
jgi:ABC-type transport system involved in cytochrome bd biosynthesis fused ATPase/permease subunit